MSEPKTSAEFQALGFTWGSDLAAPVLRVPADRLEITAFCGSATLLGDDLFLTAGHVADIAGLTENEYPCLAIFAGGKQTYHVAPIVALERHEDPEIDLAIGRFDNFMVPRTLAGWGMVAGWSDVRCFGYPDELVQTTPLDAYRFDGRFLKGYVMRTLESGDHFQLTFPALELNFPIPKGMSGAPILTDSAGGPVVCGIAASSVEIRIAQHHTITEAEEGAPRLVERIERIVEAGIALRLAPFMLWSPPILNGQKLGDLLPMRAGA